VQPPNFETKWLLGRFVGFRNMVAILSLFFVGVLIAALPPPPYVIRFPRKGSVPLGELPSLPDL